ncbi:FAD-binding protein, partial [Pseudomonas aeruginosa]|uniref:FAD-binding protein n=1 Tax=Pseudomonas aeruginosa TaxID=287 RepID=UPI001F0A725D
DPASINACKIGGIVANNASGMCCGTAQNSYHTLAGLRLLLAELGVAYLAPERLAEPPALHFADYLAHHAAQRAEAAA